MAGAKNRRVDPRMRAPRNYFSQHCSPSPLPPPLPTPLLFFFFFSLLAAFPRIENRVSRHMSRNVIFICAFYYFSRPRFLKHIVPFKHNRERGRKSSFFRFPPSFPIFSLSLFFFSLTDARQFPFRACSFRGRFSNFALSVD